MRKVMFLAGCLLMLGSPALAGRNANGALVVHTDDTILFRNAYDYCATATPAECASLITTSYLGSESISVVWFLAAFRPESSPGVTTIQFGIHHSFPANQGYFVMYAACGPSPLELPDAGFPEVSDTGNLVAYGQPVYDHLFKFTWYAVYHDSDQDFIGTRTYPSTNEAKFVDDGNPPFEDLIYNFGVVRWQVPGENECPIAQLEQACCFYDGTCRFLLEEECAALGGTAQGPGTNCTPNPCPVPEACCFVDGSCLVLPAEACLAQGGFPQGEGTSCEPNVCVTGDTIEACCFEDGHCEFIDNSYCEELGGVPQGAGTTCETVECVTTPTENSTWGVIKALFR
jgi:hypothetical protein